MEHIWTCQIKIQELHDLFKENQTWKPHIKETLKCILDFKKEKEKISATISKEVKTILISLLNLLFFKVMYLQK